MMRWGMLVAATLAAWGVARWLTGVAGAWGQRRGIVSAVTARSSHTRPTSRLGGAGLAGGFAAGAAVWLGWQVARGQAEWALFAPLALGWLVLLGVGLLDDLRDLPPLAKLAGLALGCAVPVAAHLVAFDLPRAAGQPGLLAHYGAGALLGWAWLLFFVNAFNFMDGMDGFAGNFARLAALALLAAALAAPGAALVWTLPGLLLLLAAAATGFLKWNHPPAQYFMGDGASLSTGYLLAVLPWLGARQPALLPVPFWAAQIILLPFTFDVVLTLIRRARQGENLLRAHRSHLYQRLLQTGLTHGEVLRLNLRLFVACGVLGVVAARAEGEGPRLAGLGAAALVLMLSYWRHVLRREKQARP